MKKQFLTIILATAALFAWADGYEPGDKATGFNLMNVDGQMVSLNDYNDAEGVIVIFTCNHCPYSKLYEDRIIELDKKYKSKGYPVVAINPNDSVKQPQDSYSKMIERADEKGFTFPYLLDADQSITKAYGASRTPHVFILQNSGNDFIVRYVGAVDDNSQSAADVEEDFTADAVDALLAGEEVEPDYTKAIGCTIKWAD